jgi:predicted  nucleic acid-binding Zn-ribbon protein
MTELEGQKGGKSSAEYKDLSQELTNLNRIIGACNKEIVDLTSQITKNKSAVTGLDGDIENAESSFKDLKKELDALKSIDIDPKALLELREELAQVLNLGLDEVPEDLNGIQTAIEGIKT